MRNYKKLFLIIFLIALSTITAKAQYNNQEQHNVDSLYQRVNNIEMHLNQCHNEFKTGTLFFITGVVLTGCSFFAPEDSQDKVAILGAGVATIGGLIMIDSHKHLRITNKK
jgi:maltodextrin utilization protein YvdJ